MPHQHGMAHATGLRQHTLSRHLQVVVCGVWCVVRRLSAGNGAGPHAAGDSGQYSACMQDGRGWAGGWRQAMGDAHARLYDPWWIGRGSCVRRSRSPRAARRSPCWTAGAAGDRQTGQMGGGSAQGDAAGVPLACTFQSAAAVVEHLEHASWMDWDRHVNEDEPLMSQDVRSAVQRAQTVLQQKCLPWPVGGLRGRD